MHTGLVSYFRKHTDLVSYLVLHTGLVSSFGGCMAQASYFDTARRLASFLAKKARFVTTSKVRKFGIGVLGTSCALRGHESNECTRLMAYAIDVHTVFFARACRRARTRLNHQAASG